MVLDWAAATPVLADATPNPTKAAANSAAARRELEAEENIMCVVYGVSTREF